MMHPIIKKYRYFPATEATMERIKKEVYLLKDYDEQLQVLNEMKKEFIDNDEFNGNSDNEEVKEKEQEQDEPIEIKKDYTDDDVEIHDAMNHIKELRKNDLLKDLQILKEQQKKAARKY